MAFVIAQISDLHISVEGEGPDERYQTADHLVRAIEVLNRVEPRPDLVVASGDLVDKASPEEYQRLRGLLEPLKVPLYLMVGNHDSRDNLSSEFSDHAYLPREGFMHYTIEDQPLRIICLDSMKPGHISGTMCAERLTWLDEQLSEQPDRPTFVFIHHPPFTSGLAPMDKHGFDAGDQLAAVIVKHSQVVRVAGGHLHRPVTTGWAGTVISVAPSTAHQIALNPYADTPISIVMEPPAFLLHMWDETNGLATHTIYTQEYEARDRVKFNGAGKASAL